MSKYMLEVIVDSATGETHRRHHMTPEGSYRGRQVISTEKEVVSAE